MKTKSLSILIITAYDVSIKGGKAEKMVIPMHPISIDGAEEVFYSFNHKGFVIEKSKKYFPKKRMPGSVCIRMRVPEETYLLIREEINQFIAKKEQLIYSRWGVILCLRKLEGGK